MKRSTIRRKHYERKAEKEWADYEKQKRRKRARKGQHHTQRGRKK